MWKNRLFFSEILRSVFHIPRCKGLPVLLLSFDIHTCSTLRSLSRKAFYSIAAKSAVMKKASSDSGSKGVISSTGNVHTGMSSSDGDIGTNIVPSSVESNNEERDDQVDEEEMNVVREGKAEVFSPKSVFYNPVQEFNRDLTIAVISQFARDHFRDLEEKQKKTVRKGENSLTEKISDANSRTGGSEGVNDNVDQAGQKMKEADERVAGIEGMEMETKDADKGGVDVSDSMDVEDPNLKKSFGLEAGVPCENGVRILEGLSASGLRSMRFGLEIPGVKEVVANDFDKNAVQFINKNISKNKLDGLVKSSYGDAAMVMYQNRSHKDRFDVIDLDPYGSPSQFLDAAVQAVRDGGLLCVTCTDTAVLCGNAGETCYSKYGAMSLKAKFCHEMALRIILQSIESHANRYSRYTIPVLSISADFYVRVFVKVFTGQGKVKQSVSKMALVYHCTGCGSFSLQKLGTRTPTKGNNFKYTPATGPPVGEVCQHCGYKQQLGGPIWAEEIHNVDFVKQVVESMEKVPSKLGTSPRIVGMLNLVLEEVQDAPLYYITDELCNIVHCIAPSLVTMRSAILNAGYRVSLSHAAQNSNKTNAPPSVLWDIIRTWVKDHPVKEDRLKPGTPAKAILDQPPSREISFTLHPDANPKSRQKGLLRWQTNPEPEWGPKARAKRGEQPETQVAKRERLQGKRKTKQQEETDTKHFPCKFFKKGSCTFGDDCRYGHNFDPGSASFFMGSCDMTSDSKQHPTTQENNNTE